MVRGWQIEGIRPIPLSLLKLAGLGGLVGIPWFCAGWVSAAFAPPGFGSDWLSAGYAPPPYWLAFFLRGAGEESRRREVERGAATRTIADFC